MGNDTTLNTFPRNRVEALTMLYMEKSTFDKHCTPEAFVDSYLEAYKRIKAQLREADRKVVTVLK